MHSERRWLSRGESLCSGRNEIGESVNWRIRGRPPFRGGFAKTGTGRDAPGASVILLCGRAACLSG